MHISGSAPDDPAVIPRFLETERDRAAVAPVLQTAQAVLAQPATEALIQGEEFPGPSVATREDTIAYSLATGTGLYHAVGCAAMGPNDTDVVTRKCPRGAAC